MPVPMAAVSVSATRRATAHLRSGGIGSGRGGCQSAIRSATGLVSGPALPSTCSSSISRRVVRPLRGARRHRSPAGPRAWVCVPSPPRLDPWGHPRSRHLAGPGYLPFKQATRVRIPSGPPPPDPPSAGNPRARGRAGGSVPPAPATPQWPLVYWQHSVLWSRRTRIDTWRANQRLTQPDLEGQADGWRRQRPATAPSPHGPCGIVPRSLRATAQRTVGPWASTSRPELRSARCAHPCRIFKGRGGWCTSATSMAWCAPCVDEDGCGRGARLIVVLPRLRAAPSWRVRARARATLP